MRRLHDWRSNLALAVTATTLLAGCAGPSHGSASGQARQAARVLQPVEAERPAEAERPGEVEGGRTATGLDGADPAAAGEASDAEPASIPTFRDDDPLFEELPPVEADPDNQPPEEHAPLLRKLVVDGLRASASMVATGRLDAELLRATHDARAYDQLAAGIEQLAADGLVERTPDLRFSELVIDYRNHFTVWVHACVHPGPRSGLYDVESREMVSRVDGPPLAIDLLVSRRSPPADDDPQFRIVDTFPQYGRACG